LLGEPERCELCEQKFQSKKDLQTHVLIHLGKPRVVLKRIANLKTARKETSDQYWLETEQKGNLKITLKRQSPVCDSLKLKLKKSPVSEGFTVVSSNFNLDKEDFKQYDELAEAQENDSKSDSEEEKTAEQSFENVMLNQEVCFSLTLLANITIMEMERMKEKSYFLLKALQFNVYEFYCSFYYYHIMITNNNQ
jgi:hypothetical protein